MATAPSRRASIAATTVTGTNPTSATVTLTAGDTVLGDLIVVIWTSTAGCASALSVPTCSYATFTNDAVDTDTFNSPTTAARNVYIWSGIVTSSPGGAAVTITLTLPNNSGTRRLMAFTVNPGTNQYWKSTRSVRTIGGVGTQGGNPWTSSWYATTSNPNPEFPVMAYVSNSSTQTLDWGDGNGAVSDSYPNLSANQHVWALSNTNSTGYSTNTLASTSTVSFGSQAAVAKAWAGVLYAVAVIVDATATLSNTSSTLSATGKEVLKGTATLAATSTALSATGKEVLVATATLSASSSTLTASGTTSVVASAALSASSTTLAASGTTLTNASAALTGTGTLAANGISIEVASAALSAASSTLDASSIEVLVASAALTADSSILTATASGTTAYEATAALSATPALAADGLLVLVDSPDLPGGTTLTADGTIVVLATATLSSTASVLALVSGGTLSASASLTSTSSALTAEAAIVAVGTAALAGTGDLTADGMVPGVPQTHEATADLTGSSVWAVVDVLVAYASGSIAGSSQILDLAASLVACADVDLGATSGLACHADSYVVNIALLSAVGTMLAHGVTTHFIPDTLHATFTQVASSGPNGPIGGRAAMGSRKVGSGTMTTIPVDNLS